MWLLEPFLASWRRLWDPLPPVSFAGEDPGGVDAEFLDTFLAPGWHPAGYSDALKRTLGRIKEPIVFLCPVDTFTLGPVDAGKMESLARYIINNEKTVLRVQAHEHVNAAALRANRKHVEWWEETEIVRCSKWSACSTIGGMGMDGALWNRELFIKRIEPQKMFWQIETLGTQRMYRDRPDLMSVAPWPPLFGGTDLVQNRTPNNLRDIPILEEEDREAVLAAAPGRMTVK